MASRTARRAPRGTYDDDARVAARREGLVELTQALAGALTTEDVMSVLVLEAERAFGAASAVAYVHRGHGLELVAAMGRAEDAHEWLRAIPLDARIPVALATRARVPCWFESRAALEAAFPGWSARVPHAARFGALAALPLRVGETALGAIGLAFDDERPFSGDERAAHSAAAAAGGAALHRCAKGLPPDPGRDAPALSAASRSGPR